MKTLEIIFTKAVNVRGGEASWDSPPLLFPLGAELFYTGDGVMQVKCFLSFSM